jgi:uncharacterized protein
MSPVALYGALLALLYIALSIRTLLLRRALRIPIGDGGNQQLLRAMRVHSNFSEYVPLTLLLIYLCEIRLPFPLFTHLLAIALLSGRLLHASGVSQPRENYRYRVAGMSLTFAALGLAAVALLTHSITSLLIGPGG